MIMKKAILITGASRGFGKIWARAFLQAGNQVAATARNLKDLADLQEEFGTAVLPIQLDVRNEQACRDAVNQTLTSFGRIDVVINNAGMGIFGAIEEVTAEEMRSQFDTNVYGSMYIIQAVLPVMREQQSGHIVQVSSILGVISLPVFGIYNATKFAMEAVIEALAAEVNDLGIRTTLLEPNGYGTDFAGSSAIFASPIDVYGPVKARVAEHISGDAIGDPLATVPAILEIVGMEKPPLRVILGKIGHDLIEPVYARRLEEWQSFKDLSMSAHRI